MQIDRLSTGEKISAVSAILLFVFMFFDWFGVEVSGPGGTTSFPEAGGGSAWDALDFIPIVLLAVVVVTLVAAGLRLAEADYEPPVPANAVVAVLGGLAILLILFRLLFPPSFGEFGGISVDATRQLGIFLGLLAAIGIGYGGYKAMEEEGLTFKEVADDLSAGRRGGGGSPPAPPSAPTGQAPPPGASSGGPPPPPQGPPPPAGPPPGA
ncbi:MAG TPA: hypothetical protein VK889_01185 [Solirubrobacterales bacterium]|nr:hypothetical protein [Solirubrobacterales bacterium]